MDSDDQPTCGKGLAAHAPLPAKLGELTDSVAAIPEGHIEALDLTDENSRKERDAYQALAKQHRVAGAQLRATAKEMAGFRDLPMGRRDIETLSAPAAFEAFRKFVLLEQQLVALLLARLEEDRMMLAEMGEEKAGA